MNENQFEKSMQTIKNYIDANKSSGDSTTSVSWDDITGKPTIPDSTSDLTNDSGFITIDDIPEGFDGDYNSLTNKPTIPDAYTLPTASADTLGGVKVGAGLSITDGVLSATGGGTTDSVEWTNVLNRPTALSSFTNDVGYLTEHQDLSGYAPINNPNFTNAISMGRLTSSTIGENSVALGTDVTASNTDAHAEGMYTVASGQMSHAEGYMTTASGNQSHTEGKNTTASGIGSHTEGFYTTASTTGSHAEGYYTESSGYYSHSEGAYTLAKGHYTHTEGNKTTSLGDKSHSEGDSTNQATSIITDLSTSTTNADISTAWETDKFSLAKGVASHVEAIDNLALGDYSHAEGYWNTASGWGSHAEGSKTICSGSQSHTEGYMTTASGTQAHAEGYGTVASGYRTHVEGMWTIAKGTNQHVQGRANIEDNENKYAHIVGNGEVDNSWNLVSRSNAHTLDWDGNAWYQGVVSCDGTPTNDNDLITKAYFDNNIPTSFSGSYNDLTDKPTIPSSTSQIANNSGYITSNDIPTSLPANGGNADTVDNFHIWSGTQAELDAIGTRDVNTIYLVKEG